jgi:putative MATE family efflux protein
LPTTLTMMIRSLYCIVDGIFISRYVGTNALSATNIVFPIIYIIISLATMFAMGSNAIIAKKMGEGKAEEARGIFTMIVFLGFLTGILLAVIGIAFLEPCVRLLGSGDLLLNDCMDYLGINLIFAAPYILQILFQTFLVTEGRPNTSLVLTTFAGITNVILDYIFMVPLQMGVKGAALATGIGYMIPAVPGLIYFMKSRKTLYFTKPLLKLHYFTDSCKNGSSGFIMNISTGIVTLFFNIVMLRIAGADGVAAITIIQYAQFLLISCFMGFSQGVAPVISFNYGSRNYPQLRQIFRVSMICIGIASLVIVTGSEVLGSRIAGVFAPEGSSVYRLANYGMAVFSTNFLFAGFNTYASIMFSAFSNGKISSILSFIRSFALILIALLLLPPLCGITGVWLAIPVAEAGCFVLTLYYLKRNHCIYHYA